MFYNFCPWKTIALSLNIIYSRNLNCYMWYIFPFKIMILVIFICLPVQWILYVLKNLNLIWTDSLYYRYCLWSTQYVNIFICFCNTIEISHQASYFSNKFPMYAKGRSVRLSWYESISFVLNSDKLLVLHCVDVNMVN